MDEDSENSAKLYQVNVVILEGRHLALTNANTHVVVSIGKRKKKIHSKSNKTDSPYYNDFCVFPFHLPLNVLLDEILSIKVYQITRLIKKLVGSFSVELSTVWSQPNHQFYHKWAVLSDPKFPTSGVKGFLKCDIAILCKGTVLKPPDDEDFEEEVEENLLVPYGGIKDRHRARIVFSVFRADSFSTYFSESPDLNFVQPYIRITYGGNVRQTSIAKDKESPVWNEELMFFDLFPPLFQNILIEICDNQKPPRKRSMGNTNIDIRSLYEDGKEGFLPTFGPNFLYLYQPYRKFERHSNCCSIQNSFTYMCRVLLAMRTEIVHLAEDVYVKKKKPKTVPKPIAPLIENVYFEYNKFILFAAILDVLFFDAKYIEANINIRIALGPKKNLEEVKKKKKKKDEANEDTLVLGELEKPKHLNTVTTCSTTPNHKCKIKADYSFIAFSGKFPCVHTFGEWPNSLRRMYRSNIIKKVIQDCTQKINKVKDELQFEQGNFSQSSQKLKDILDDLSKRCEIILLLTKTIKKEDTNLFRERKVYYHKEIADIVEKTKVASSKTALKTEDVLRKISAYLATLTKYAQDPENSFPYTEIWMRKNGKINAHYRLKTEDIAYSSDFNERGIMSGKPQTIMIQNEKERTKVKMDIFVWFGLADDFMQCLKMLPNGFRHDHQSCTSSIELKIPSEITYDEAHHFQCRIHIYQAKILTGFDKTGLADVFTRIIIFGQNKATQVQKATLSPVWDETLLFPVVTLYGPSDYIKENSVNIIVEVFDKEKVSKSELIGRCLVKPLVKLKDEKYEPPTFPPRLKWEEIKENAIEIGKILMAAELLEISDSLKDLYSFSSTTKSAPLSIPAEIRPHNAKYRLEIIFWGFRQLKKKNYFKNKVFLTLECGEHTITSPIIKNVKRKLNFDSSLQFIELNLPEEYEYAPPLFLKLFHLVPITSIKSYLATCIVPSVQYFFYPYLNRPINNQDVFIELSEEDKIKEMKKQEKKRKLKILERNRKIQEAVDNVLFKSVQFWRYFKCKVFKKCEDSAYELQPEIENEKLDWWARYHASTTETTLKSDILTFKVYHEELEAQPEFKGLQDFLHTFELITGHGKDDKNKTLIAKVKIALALYKWPIENETGKKFDSEKGFFSGAPTNEPVKTVVRVYVICGKNFAPKDIYGKSDPYLLVQLGDTTINDREHYVPKQINPTFGKCFEFKATFPHDYLLRVKVIDYDSSSKDDLIGETVIDVENRYYSKYHASCGIPKFFEKDNANGWRDIFLPTDILSKVCNQCHLNPPIYEPQKVKIEDYEFSTPVPKGTIYKEEIQALNVLNRWHEVPFYGYHLVPEHIETRSLYHPAVPGIEQGKLEMWVDVFPADFRYMTPKVDITPHKPVAMELRAIVWNVDDVVLDDKSFIFNDRMSDIYVRGWILSLEEDTQRTDVHYRSFNGEGNFNWRFIFHFKYIPAEKMMVVKKKIDAFDFHPEEKKHQCKLEIQIWDNDAFGDDYLGTLILELCSMPRGAKLSNRCTLKMLSPNSAKINLFKIKKTRGWWPFRRLKERQSVGNEFELTGKIDLELEILTEAEAKQFPAGKGREEPDALPPPVRPATSFNWLVSPWKTFRYIIWRKIARAVIIGLMIALLVFFILTGLYAIPNYVVKKLLNA